MSEPDISTQANSEELYEKGPQLQDSDIAERVIQNSVFRMMLKDMIEELFQKKTNDNMEQSIIESKIGVDDFIEEIGDSLMLVAQTEASKRIKETQTFLNQMYELKVKEIRDHFEVILQKKLKVIDEKIKQIEEQARNDKNQSFFLSPVKNNTKSKKLIESSFCQQINKRFQLKEKLLNSSVLPDPISQIQLRMDNLIIPDYLRDGEFDRPLERSMSTDRALQKIKSVEDEFRQQTRLLNQKFTSIVGQIKKQQQDLEENVREQINTGFEGIWNVISNLEKRMINLH